jgi:zinc protease
MHEIRDVRGLAYGTSATQRLASEAGIFQAEASTDPINTEAVLEILQEQLQILADEPLTEAELRRAIGQAQGQRLIFNESALARAVDLSGAWLLGVRESISDFEARLAAVSSADVQRVARTYLAPERQLHVVVAP